MFIYFIMIFQSFIASGTHIVAKVVVRDVNPATLTMMRSLLAAVGLYILAKFRGTIFKFYKQDLKNILFLSFLGIPVNQFLFLYAIKLTTPSNAALLYSTTPAMVLIISSIYGTEKIFFKRVVGIIIAFVGILIVIFERGIDLRSDYTVGNIILFFAVIAWALYTVKGKAMIPKYGAFKTSAATMIIGALMFIPIGFFNFIEFDFSKLTIGHWGGIFYLAFGTSIFAYLLWYYALSKIDATKVAVFSNLQPVITTVLSVILLGQIITPFFIIGGVIAIFGVIITQYA